VWGPCLLGAAPRPCACAPVRRGTWRGLRLSETRARARSACPASPMPSNPWSRLLDPLELQEGLYFLDVLTAILHRCVRRRRGARRLRVGSTNAMHVPALHALCPSPRRWSRIDAHRRLLSLVTRLSRRATSRARTPAAVTVVGIVARSVKRAASGSDLTHWKLPFIFEGSPRPGGCPGRFFRARAVAAGPSLGRLLRPVGCLTW